MVLIRVTCGKTVDSACKSLKYVLSFLTSDEAQQYDKYYISVNGTDKSMCGKTVDSACKSLKYVLSFLTSDEGQQYDKYYISVNGTDKSIVW